MYPYHEVLHMCEPDIEFYVVDVRRMLSGQAKVTLTVLTSTTLSRQMQHDVELAVQRAMSNEDVRRLAWDLGWAEAIDYVPVFEVKAKYFGEARS